MTDDRTDELLLRAARDYNEPGPVPREQMWSAISAARVSSRPGRHVWRWSAGAAAAVALISVGVVIGRSTRPSTPIAVAVNPVIVTPPADTTHPRKPDPAARQLASAPRPRSTPRPATVDDSRQLANRLFVLRHLAGSEALITAFRTTAERGEVDPQVAEWARELLGTTRLLEASSSAGADPVMKRLLEDLDLVMSQIAQYAARGTYDPTDLDLIEQSITRRGVMTTLRGTTAPSAAHM